jgi:uncharacterized protein YaaQ
VVVTAQNDWPNLACSDGFIESAGNLNTTFAIGIEMRA